jgi:hypothetical protein
MNGKIQAICGWEMPENRSISSYFIPRKDKLQYKDRTDYFSSFSSRRTAIGPLPIMAK